MEKTRVLKRGAIGFMAGVFVSYTMAILMSLIFGEGAFYPVDLTMLEDNTATVYAVVVQYIGTGLIGMFMGINLWVFEKEEWNIAMQTMVHFIFTASAVVLYLTCTNANKAGISRTIVYVLLLSVIYFVIWMIRMRNWQIQVRKIRQKMQELSEEEFTILDRRIQRNTRIIRGFLVLAALVILLICFVVGRRTIWREWKIASLPSTTLTQITVDHACMYDSIEALDLTKYTESDRYSGPYRYLFDEICVDIDEENKITSMFTRFDEDKTEISISGQYGVTTIDQIIELLGDEYYEYMYDTEQLLKAYVYHDKEHKILATFVFFDFDGKAENDRMLTWMKLETE